MKKARFLIPGIVCLFLLTVQFGLTFPTAHAKTKSIELSFAGGFPAKAAPYHSAFLPWAEEIEKRTDGKLTIKFYFSQTLVKDKDQYAAVRDGIADIGWTAHSLTPGRFPLISVMENPFLNPSTHIGAHVLGELYDKYPQIRKEHQDVHLLFLWTTLPYEIHTSKKPVRTLEDLKGLKIACPAGAVPTLEKLGAVPVTVGMGDLYQVTQKGVADGVALAWGAYKSRKIYEVTKYHTNIHMGGMPFWTAMNKNTWNKLPPEFQKVVTEVTEEMMPDTLCDAVTKEYDKGIAISKDLGHEIIELSPEERARWVEATKPALDAWVKKISAKGLPAEEVLADAIKLVEGYKK